MEKDILEDISAIDLNTKVSVDNPIDYKGLMILKQSTPARICDLEQIMQLLWMQFGHM